MMRSATAFLPDSITTFMNFERSTDPNLGSGRISRLGTSRRRGMVFPSSASVGARLLPDSPDGHRVEWDHPLTRRNVESLHRKFARKPIAQLLHISFADSGLSRRRPDFQPGAFKLRPSS